MAETQTVFTLTLDAMVTGLGRVSLFNLVGAVIAGTALLVLLVVLHR